MHSHEHRGSSLRTPPRVQLVLVAVILPIAALTVIGLVSLWPDSSRQPDALAFSAPGVTFPRGEVLDLRTAACTTGDVGDSTADTEPSAEAPASAGRAEQCGVARVSVASGAGKGTVVEVDIPPQAVAAGLGKGVVLLRTPDEAGAPATYSFYDVQRGRPLVLLALVFVVVVAAVARWRGVRSLVGLGFAGVVLVTFMLPSLLSGHSPTAVGLTAASAIMLVVLYTAHGLSGRTSTALLGTFAGLGLTAVAGWAAVRAAHLSGVSSDDNLQLQAIAHQLDPRALLTCGIILAGLGVLNDVTITQSSAVWELRAAAPQLGRRGLYAGAMRVGRDHIASTVYTIVFAYAGAALPVLLLIELYGQPLGSVLTNADIAEELVRTMASAIGLVLAVPATTALAVAVATAGRPVHARTRDESPEASVPAH